MFSCIWGEDSSACGASEAMGERSRCKLLWFLVGSKPSDGRRNSVSEPHQCRQLGGRTLTPLLGRNTPDVLGTVGFGWYYFRSPKFTQKTR